MHEYKTTLLAPCGYHLKTSCTRDCPSYANCFTFVCTICGCMVLNSVYCKHCKTLLHINKIYIPESELKSSEKS